MTYLLDEPLPHDGLQRGPILGVLLEEAADQVPEIVGVLDRYRWVGATDDLQDEVLHAA